MSTATATAVPRATNTRTATTTTRRKKKTVLERNLELIRLSKGMSVDDFRRHMGWGSVATYYDKSHDDAPWKVPEILRLCKLAGKSFEDIFTKPLLG